MDALGKIYAAARDEIYVDGIPKTIDNDLAATDHAPGYASNAQYMAAIVNDCNQDVKGMPIHVSIIEAMGRNTGWLAAASALAKRREGDAPHLIYFPERPFEEEKFLRDVKACHDKYGGVVVVASEGLKYADGKQFVKPVLTVGRSVYFGDVSAHLAYLVLKELGIKARSEKPGLIGRCSSPPCERSRPRGSNPDGENRRESGPGEGHGQDGRHQENCKRTLRNRTDSDSDRGSHAHGKNTFRSFHKRRRKRRDPGLP